MDTQTAEVTPILKVAWTRVAQLDAIASRRSKGHLTIRRWITILGVLSTFFAILTQLLDMTGFKQRYPLLSVTAQIIFIAIPFLASTLAALASKKYSNGDWLVTRAGAEEVKKEITLVESAASARTVSIKTNESSNKAADMGLPVKIILSY